MIHFVRCISFPLARAAQLDYCCGNKRNKTHIFHNFYKNVGLSCTIIYFKSFLRFHVHVAVMQNHPFHPSLNKSVSKRPLVAVKLFYLTLETCLSFGSSPSLISQCMNPHLSSAGYFETVFDSLLERRRQAQLPADCHPSTPRCQEGEALICPGLTR